jgi:hypothetical protein
MSPLVPRPAAPPPTVHAGFCSCGCHDCVEGDIQESAQRRGEHLRRAKINGLGSIAVPVVDELDAFFACACCQRHHCAALVYRPPPPPKVPYVDPPKASPQSDGEGPE